MPSDTLVQVQVVNIPSITVEDDLPCSTEQHSSCEPITTYEQHEPEQFQNFQAATIDFVRELPAELVLGIVELLPVQDCISISHVSQSWRSFVIHAPSVWSVFSTSYVPVQVINKLLSRSCSLGLKLKLEATYSTWMEVAKCLRLSLDRCIYLKLRMKRHLSYEAADALTEVLCLSAPRMRTFKLIDGNAKFNNLRAAEYTVNLFSGRPRLCRVKLCSDIAAFCSSSASFGSVTSLLYANPINTSLHDLRKILQLFPQLRRLGLDLDDWPKQQPLDCVYTGDILSGLALETLVLFATKARIVEPIRILSYFDHAAIGNIHIRYRHDPYSSQGKKVLRLLESDIVPHRVEALSIWFTPHDNNISMVMSTRDRLWERVMVRGSRAVLPSHDVFQSIRTLSLGESIFPETMDSYPAMPSLEELTLLTLERDEYRAFGADSLFMLPRTRDRSRTLVCPKLVGLQVRAAETPPTYIAPEVLREFIEWHLEFDSPQLQKLCLIGVTLLDNIVDEVAALISSVESFQSFKAIPWRDWGTEDLSNWN